MKKYHRALRNQVIYSVYVRNHTAEGTFRAVEPDLSRIKELGTDIVWLLPIHPIGRQNRKGSMGCPYAISDYRSVNPEYGTLDDFRSLVDAIHAQGMKCIIDVVYNHTSPDSWLARHHPEWFYKNPEGAMGNRCGDWQDVVDLDYSHKELREYQIQTLEQWAEIVDGFRCDVASAVPVDFWAEARERVEKLRPGSIWLAESVHPDFIRKNRKMGFNVHADAELYAAFDITYDYDIHDEFVAYFHGGLSLKDYISCIRRQETIYPGDYLKLRFLENHDQPRARSFITDDRKMRNYLTMVYMLKGVTLVYAGQEVSSTHIPSLFEKDPVDWNGRPDISGFLKKLYAIRQNPLLSEGYFDLSAGDDFVVIHYQKDTEWLLAVMNIGGNRRKIPVGVPDGVYTNEIDGSRITVSEGKTACGGEPMILLSRTAV